MASFIQWAYFRFQPEAGWLPLGLLLTAVSSGIVAVIEVGWVPEDGVVVWAALGGLLLSVLLAERDTPTWLAWGLIVGYGVVVVTAVLAQLWPAVGELNETGLSLPDYWRFNGALFYDRFGSWVRAAVTNGRSRETIVFAFGLGLLTWLLAAYAGWSTYRNRKPLVGLSLMALAISVNLYFGDVPPFWSAIFVGQAALLTAFLQFSTLEAEWRDNRVDFSEEVRTDVGLYALLIAAGLLGISYAIPSVPYTQIAQAFANRPAVQAAEDSFTQLFGGVAQPRSEPSPGGVGGRGILPRAYLLGNAPELYEIEMMTAQVFLVDANGNEQPATPTQLSGTHWRALSYAEYTGRGWALSEERTEILPPNQTITFIEAEQTQTFIQRVEWLKDNRLTRYTLGTPVQIDQEATLFWRGLTDLVRVLGSENAYEVTTVLPVVTDDELRNTAVSDIPPPILERYTALPDGVPERVHDLAQEIAGDVDNPYDQARAIEQFLRQYPYSLGVSLPPENGDPVDYFLFELQTGYCDYYASSMVVLARSLGLPARMAVGFLPQAPDENGVQTIYQINGHSWAEVYFAGVGWVEFEPTSAFVSPRDADAQFSASDAPEGFEPVEATPPPIPEVEGENGRIPRRLFLIIPIIILFIFWQLRQRQLSQRELVLWQYERLQTRTRQLGLEIPLGSTPNEFRNNLAQFLERYQTTNKVIRYQLGRLVEAAAVVVEQVNRQQYSTAQKAQMERMQWAFDRSKRPLRLLRLVNLFKNRKAVLQSAEQQEEELN